MGINAAQLRAFHAVASEGSFTTAARALNVTQPTVSSQVKALEGTYGVRLFDRQGRGARLTEAGQSLLDITQRIFTLEDEAEDLLSSTRELRSGEIRAGSDGPHHIIPVLAALVQRHPAITVMLEMGNAERMMRELRNYRIDVAILAKREDDERLHYEVFLRSPLVVFVPRTHPWARRRHIRLAEVGEQPMILREAASMTRQIFQSALDDAGISPKSVMQIESREAVREAVAAGLGIGVVPKVEFDRDQRLVALPIRDANLEITEYMVCLRERKRLRVVRAFLDVARTLCGPAHEERPPEPDCPGAQPGDATHVV